MVQGHKTDLRLPHRIDVGEAANCLLGPLDCDGWHVACQHDHLLVIQFSKAGAHEYAVRFECSAPVEKGIFHGSKAWSLCIIPLRDNPVVPTKLAEIKLGLEQLE